MTGNGRTQVRAASLLNAQGAINALDSLDMQFTGKLDNRQGEFSVNRLRCCRHRISSTRRAGWAAWELAGHQRRF
ncbi:hypothetical protein M5585_15230 [Serratia ureilytica]